MTLIQNSFDIAASTWTEKPHRVKMATDIADAIRKKIPFHGDLNVLDYGSGVGLVSLQLVNELHSLTAADSSQAMLSEMKKRAVALTDKPVHYVLLSDQSSALKENSFDLIICTMVLHHIRDYEKMLQSFTCWLKPGGYMAIIDLHPEDGSFHEDYNEFVHNGFKIDKLKQCTDQLLDSEIDENFMTIERERKSGLHNYSLFFLTGRKR